MAQELSITPAAYRKIETGETKLTVERLFRISDILKVSPLDLLEIGNDVFQQTKKVQPAISKKSKTFTRKTKKSMKNYSKVKTNKLFC
jgi:transcriptional regulator with XRE-family HTH domain